MRFALSCFLEFPMKPIIASLTLISVSTALLLTLAGCNNAHGDQAAEAPPAANVVPALDAALFSVDHPEQFPLAAATQHPTTSELVVTGTIDRKSTRLNSSH